MKIGILTSSPDSLYLFRFLNEYDFSYHIWYDQEGGHRGDKSSDFVQKRIERGLDYLIEQGVTKCILPPRRELAFLSNNKYKEFILPLFYTYITQQVLLGSRLGKIGLIGDWSDITDQRDIKTLFETYNPTEIQLATKNFSQPFQFWSKDVSMRKHFLVSLGRKDRMMHNVVKSDLRYFTDAGIDTLIPLNYGYFAYDVSISKFFRTKKCNWHGLKKIASVFDALTKGYEKSTYSVTISHTGTLEQLQNEKKWMRLLQKGKNIIIESKKI